MFISRNYYTLLTIYVASVSMNNYFSVPGRDVYKSFNIFRSMESNSM